MSSPFPDRFPALGHIVGKGPAGSCAVSSTNLDM